MRFFKQPLNIDFLGVRKPVMIFAVLFIVASSVSLATRGLNFGIDFTGGVVIEVNYPQSVDLPDVRAALGDAGYTDAIVQHFGTSKDVMIRLQPEDGAQNNEITAKIMEALKAKTAGVEQRRVEFVGPQVGKELAYQGALATLFALIGILIYVAIRFDKKFGLGAIAATVHDVIFTLGWFSFFHIQFDLTVLAAVLAVVGYSLNDTIVVFDRIRENFRLMRRAEPIEVMNASINQTMSRTIMTSFTTLVVVIVLFFFGGEIVHGFSLALIIGIFVGTMSSIYIASAFALLLGAKREDLLPPEKKDEMHQHTP